MNINRNNYEEYFLLYVDNELSAADKKAVELFVEENADLQNELLLLKEAVLNIDVVSFEGKEMLTKEEIPFSAIQEKLLLHLDNELNKEEKLATEKLITTDKSIALEWGVLQQTKSTVDTSILFENKESLYKKDTGRIVAFPWRRIAAAAILIGFGVWGYISFFNKEIAVNDGVAITNDDAPDKKIIGVTTPDTAIVGINSNNTLQATVAVEQQQTKKTVAAIKSKLPDQQNKNITDDKNIVTTKKSSIKPDDKINDLDLENLNNLPSNKTIVRNVQQEKQEIIIPEINNKTALANKEMPNEKNKDVTLVSNTDPENENDDRIFYVKESKLKKTKAGAFLSKAKKLLNRNSDGINSIAVGNIEIAIK